MYGADISLQGLSCVFRIGAFKQNTQVGFGVKVTYSWDERYTFIVEDNGWAYDRVVQEICDGKIVY